jgi:hypothetical protein
MTTQIHVSSNGYNITATFIEKDDQALTFYAEPVELTPESFSFFA